MRAFVLACAYVLGAPVHDLPKITVCIIENVWHLHFSRALTNLYGIFIGECSWKMSIGNHRKMYGPVYLLWDDVMRTAVVKCPWVLATPPIEKCTGLKEN